MPRRPAVMQSALQIFSFAKGVYVGHSPFDRIQSRLSSVQPEWAELQAGLFRSLRCAVEYRAARWQNLTLNFSGKRFTIRPYRAILKMLLLPDGNGTLEGINQPTAGVECGGAMGACHHDEHARCTDL